MKFNEFAERYPALYHGTSMRYAHSILTRGLIPNSPGSRLRSRDPGVFLGLDSALVYAFDSFSRGDSGAIIVEIPTRALDSDFVNPGLKTLGCHYMRASAYAERVKAGITSAMRWGAIHNRTDAQISSEISRVIDEQIFDAQSRGDFCFARAPELNLRALNDLGEVSYQAAILPVFFSRVLILDKSFACHKDIVFPHPPSLSKDAARWQLMMSEFDAHGLSRFDARRLARVCV